MHLLLVTYMLDWLCRTLSNIFTHITTLLSIKYIMFINLRNILTHEISWSQNVYTDDGDEDYQGGVYSGLVYVRAIVRGHSGHLSECLCQMCEERLLLIQRACHWCATVLMLPCQSNNLQKVEQHVGRRKRGTFWPIGVLILHCVSKNAQPPLYFE